jgi:hypothetical protein
MGIDTLRTKIHEMVNEIEDESALNILMKMPLYSHYKKYIR